MSSLTDLEYGCVIFDNPSEHKSGWVSVEGAASIRITGTQELATNIMWITNLSFSVMQESGFSQSSRFRRHDFLREDIQKILWSVGALKLAPNQQAEIISGIFSRVMHLSRHWLKMCRMPLYDIASGFRELVLDPDPQVYISLSEAVEDAVEYWVKTERSLRRDEGQHMIFRLGRIAHAKQMFEVLVPSGPWGKIPITQLPVTNDINSWLEDLQGRVLAKITINRVNPDVNDLINYGSGASLPGSASAKYRRWVSSDELAWLSPLCDLKVEEVWICEQLEALPYRDFVRDTLGELHEVSLSLSIFAENLWVACGKKLGARGQGQSANTLTPFLRARDRLTCYAKAYDLYKEGWEIAGYGAGKISVRIPTSVPKSEIMDLAVKHNLIPPPLDLADDSTLTSDAGPFRMAQSLFAKSDPFHLLDVDKKIVSKVLNLNPVNQGAA